MFLKDNEIVVIVTPTYDGQIGCFVLESLLNLRYKKGLLSNLPHEDLTKGYDVGSIAISPKQEQQVKQWLSNGRFIVLKRDFFGKFSFTFCTKLQLQNKGLTEEDFAWLEAWCESADYQYQQDTKNNSIEKEIKAKKSNQTKKFKKKKLFFDDEGDY